MNFTVKLSAELIRVPVFSRYGKLSDKNVQSLIFGTPYDIKNGWKQLQHTFLDQPNTFCFMNFALKLSAELRRDQKK
jgi:hypothetical protein